MKEERWPWKDVHALALYPWIQYYKFFKKLFKRKKYGEIYG